MARHLNIWWHKVTLEVLNANMSVEEAASYLRLSKTTLNRWRVQGCGPAYAQATTKGRVIYRRCHLDAWLAACTRRNTSEVIPEIRTPRP